GQKKKNILFQINISDKSLEKKKLKKGEIQTTQDLLDFIILSILFFIWVLQFCTVIMYLMIFIKKK
ncbi:unnamed protein product, partial [Arabidopsis halleri]